MANNTSTAPLAFNAVFNWIAEAAAAMTPQVDVFHSELLQNEPADYVLLSGIENHRWEWSSLSSFAFEEDYDIVGCVSVLTGDAGTEAGIQTIANTYALYQNVVQATMVQHRAYPVISDDAQNAGVNWIIPKFARYETAPGQFGDGEGGLMGRIDFAYAVHARVTVPS